MMLSFNLTQATGYVLGKYLRADQTETPVFYGGEIRYLL
jgi:hypothetical protein